MSKWNSSDRVYEKKISLHTSESTTVTTTTNNSHFPPPQAPQSVVNLGFQYDPRPSGLWPVYIKICYSHYLQILYSPVSLYFPWSSSFPYSYNSGNHYLFRHSFVIRPFNMATAF